MQKKMLTTDCDICETLLIPLYARAREQHQQSPLLIDVNAAELIKHIDYNFQKFELSPVSMAGVVLRASYFDVIVGQFIKRHPNPIVVHLGYGLDTRVQRLGSLAKKALFYHIDLDEVMMLRETLLPAEANETYILSCMFESQWMDEIKQQHPNASFIFILEGVLMYFERLRNQRLFKNLASRFPQAEIHFDVISMWMCSHTYLHDAVRFTGAQFKFGLDNDQAIENWHPRLKYQGSYNLMTMKGGQRAGLPFIISQHIFPPLRSVARVVAYWVNDK